MFNQINNDVGGGPVVVCSIEPFLNLVSLEARQESLKQCFRSSMEEIKVKGEVK